jgi:hypothetical protein
MSARGAIRRASSSCAIVANLADCANTAPSAEMRLLFGSSYDSTAAGAAIWYDTPAAGSPNFGIRCARVR